MTPPERTDRDVIRDAAERLGRMSQEAKHAYDVRYFSRHHRTTKLLFENYTRCHRLSTELLKIAEDLR